MARILVTGGAGYIGSHFCKHAASKGHTLCVVDNLSTGFERLVKWSELVCADVRDTAKLRQTIDRFGAEVIVHFAASAYVGVSVQQPLDYYENNVNGLQSVIKAARDGGVKRIIFSSTCAVYGVPEILPITEGVVERPVNPYGETKLACERLLHWCARAYGMQWVALRYFNAAGADFDGEIGELHDPETHLIPLAMAAAAGRGEPLHVFGTDYATKDGTAVRDYVHVNDLASAHLCALDYLEGGGVSRQFNLGIGVGYSVREVLDTIERVTGHTVPRKESPRRAGDPPALFASAIAARGQLRWQPRYGLEEIVSSAWGWMQKQS